MNKTSAAATPESKASKVNEAGAGQGPDWVVIDYRTAPPKIVCSRCLAEEPLNLPRRVTELAGWIHAWAQAHADCPPLPDGREGMHRVHLPLSGASAVVAKDAPPELIEALDRVALAAAGLSDAFRALKALDQTR